MVKARALLSSLNIPYSLCLLFSLHLSLLSCPLSPTPSPGPAHTTLSQVPTKHRPVPGPLRSFFPPCLECSCSCPRGLHVFALMSPSRGSLSWHPVLSCSALLTLHPLLIFSMVLSGHLICICLLCICFLVISSSITQTFGQGFLSVLFIAVF